MLKKSKLDRILEKVDPARAKKRYMKKVAKMVAKRHYEGATSGRRTDGWITPTSSAQGAVAGRLTRLRDRSRDLTRNNPYATRAVEIIASATLGKGLMAQVRPTAPFKDNKRVQRNAKIVEQLWVEWTKNPDSFDVAGQSNFNAMQRLAMRGVIEGGEILVKRKRMPSGVNKVVPLRIQLLEPDHLDTNKDSMFLKSSTETVKEGIVFDIDGRAIAYNILKSHPGDSAYMAKASESIRVSADDISHMFRMDRAGQIRGVPWGAPVIIRLKDLDDYMDAQLLRQKIAACWTAFVTDGSIPDDVAKAEVEEDMGSFEPGIIEVLPPGKNIEFASPPGVDGFAEYMRVNLTAIASAYGITYEMLTSDLSNVNFSSGRMGRIEVKRLIDQWRDHTNIPKFNAKVWEWFIEAISITGIDTKGITVDWTAPRWEMIDPQKETKAIKEQVLGGLISISEAQRQGGYDSADLMEEIARDNTRVDELGIILDTDARKTLTPVVATSEDGVDEEEEGARYYKDPKSGTLYRQDKNGKLTRA